MKEFVDARISFTGFLAALAGLVYLAIRFHGDPVLAAMLVYGASVCALFGASSLYHGVAFGARGTAVLRRLDHAAIYVLIAGSYTPVLFVGLDGAWRIATIAAIWSAAVAGIVLTVWFVNAPRWVSAAVYIGAGGIFYTAGAVVYATKRVRIAWPRLGFHEAFHLFVLAGATIQFVAIAHFLT